MAAPKGNQYAKGLHNGRPKVNPEDYNANWKQEVIGGYKLGKSDVWVRVNCFKDHTVSEDLWYRWIDEIDDFSLIIKSGHESSQSWWENVSQDHADGTNPQANATSLIFNMSNRFKDGRNSWQQRVNVEQTTKLSLDVNELDKLREYLAEHGVDLEDL